MSVLIEDQQNKPKIYENARKRMQLIANQSLPQCILLIYGYIRICIENNCHDIIIPKSIIKFILKGLNALRLSNELKPFFTTPIEKLPGLKSGVISLMKVVEAINVDQVTNTKNDEIIRLDPAKQKRDKLVSTVAKILVKLCDANRNFVVINNEINAPFYDPGIPSVSIHDYLQRFNDYSRCSDDVFIMALIYIDRLIKKKDVMVNIYTIYRILLVSIMIAAKFQDDIHFNNKLYAMVGGVTIKSLNNMESHFLFSLSFDLFIQPNEFQMYYNKVSNFL